jgi:hypothetical protein
MQQKKHDGLSGFFRDSYQNQKNANMSPSKFNIYLEPSWTNQGWKLLLVKSCRKVAKTACAKWCGSAKDTEQ